MPRSLLCDERTRLDRPPWVRVSLRVDLSGFGHNLLSGWEPPAKPTVCP